MAILLKSSGHMVMTDPASGQAFTLAELQGFVGGYIEIVRAPGDGADARWLVLNEDGKRLQLRPNEAATWLYHQAGGMLDDVVVGDVLLATLTEIGGDE